MRRKRVLTPELRRRLKLRATLDFLDINLTDLSKKSGLDISVFSRFLSNDIGESAAERIILEAIKDEQKRVKARKPSRIVYI